MTASRCERLGSDCTRKVGYGGLCKLLQTVKVINILKTKPKQPTPYRQTQESVRAVISGFRFSSWWPSVPVGSGSSIS